MNTNAMARLISFCLQNRIAGWRKAIVSERRTAVDWATEIRRLLEDDYADSDKVILVCDQLNIHKLSSLYEAFEPTTARRLVERLEIHHTPKHGSWLNIAENELSALTRQCLDRRTPDREILERETTAWYIERNRLHSFGELAILNHRCPHPPQASLPTNRKLTDH